MAGRGGGSSSGDERALGSLIREHVVEREYVLTYT